MQGTNGRNGINRRVLDSSLSNPRGERFSSFSGERAAHKECAGPKSDVSDCQWIQYLHSVGLLKASFRPPDEICVIRSLWRHRESLVQMAAEHTMHMQKALSQMNLQLHHVLSESTGVSGLAILDAILAGERDPAKLASLCNWRVRSSRETVAKSIRSSSLKSTRNFSLPPRQLPLAIAGLDTSHILSCDVHRCGLIDA